MTVEAMAHEHRIHVRQCPRMGLAWVWGRGCGTWVCVKEREEERERERGHGRVIIMN